MLLSIANNEKLIDFHQKMKLFQYLAFVMSCVVWVQALCPDGWMEFDDHCYLEVRENLPFVLAELKCQEKGGDMATIPNQRVHEFLKTGYGLESAEHWIGLRSTNWNMCRLRWEDGSPAWYTNWIEGFHRNAHIRWCRTYGDFCRRELNYGVEQERCAFLTRGSRKWNEDDCYAWRYFLCSQPSVEAINPLQEEIQTLEAEITRLTEENSKLKAKNLRLKESNENEGILEEVI